LLFSVGIEVAAVDSKLGEVSYVVNDVALVTNTTAVVANNIAKVLNDTALVVEEISIATKDTAAVTSETAVVVNGTARHMKTVTDVIHEFSGHLTEIRRDLDKLVKSGVSIIWTFQKRKLTCAS
jgi:methyl-accepting chemotaxis protein